MSTAGFSFPPDKRGRFPVADKAARTIDGIVFASAKQARRYAELKLLERAGEIRHLECEYAMDVRIGTSHFCRYTADFRFFDVKLGRLIYEDTKSSGTAKDAAYKLRKKAAELFHGVKITEHIV